MSWLGFVQATAAALAAGHVARCRSATAGPHRVAHGAAPPFVVYDDRPGRRRAHPHRSALGAAYHWVRLLDAEVRALRR